MPGMPQVIECLEQFKAELVPAHLRDKLKLTSPYELFSGDHGVAHWPATYGKVWGDMGNNGVYLHFDANDQLLYVGKAVSIGQRFGNYFATEGGKCYIKDPALKEVVRVRAVILEGDPLRFLAPSLEWFLIDRLSPTVNKQYNRMRPAEDESESRTL